MKRIFSVFAAIYCALPLCACADVPEQVDSLWLEIPPAAEGEFGEPMRDDGTYLIGKVFPPAPDPYAEDVRQVSAGVTDSGLTFSIYEHHAEITGHTDDFKAEELVIPETLDGLPVTRIADAETDPDNAFTLAQEGAFSSCYTLREVTLPECLTKIGSYAFYGCRNLRSITIPEGVTEIGQRALAMCASLKKLTVPAAIGTIGSDAFALTPWYDTLLSERDLIIFNGVLYDTGKLCVGDVVIPDYVTEIADYAFYCTPNMDSVEIPASVQRIGVNAFLTCHELRKVVIENPDCEIAAGEKTFSNKLEGGNKDYFFGTFYAAEGSTAQRFAKAHDFAFEAL